MLVVMQLVVLQWSDLPGLVAADVGPDEIAAIIVDDPQPDSEPELVAAIAVVVHEAQSEP